MNPSLTTPRPIVPITLKLLGISWGAAGVYLFYGIYGDWVMAKMYPGGAAGFYRLSVLFGIGGILSTMAAIAMFRPWKPGWFAALATSVMMGWYWFPIALSSGLPVPVVHLLLYGFTFVYFLTPGIRVVFGIGMPLKR